MKFLSKALPECPPSILKYHRTGVYTCREKAIETRSGLQKLVQSTDFKYQFLKKPGLVGPGSFLIISIDVSTMRKCQLDMGKHGEYVVLVPNTKIF